MRSVYKILAGRLQGNLGYLVLQGRIMLKYILENEV